MVDFVIDDYSLNGGQHSADADERFAQRFAGELTPGQILQARRLVQEHRLMPRRPAREGVGRGNERR